MHGSVGSVSEEELAKTGEGIVTGGGEGAACADDGTVTEEELETGEGIVGVVERIAWADDDTVSAEPETDAEGIVIGDDERTAWADDGTIPEEEIETGEGIVIGGGRASQPGGAANSVLHWVNGGDAVTDGGTGGDILIDFETVGKSEEVEREVDNFVEQRLETESLAANWRVMVDAAVTWQLVEVVEQLLQ